MDITEELERELAKHYGLTYPLNEHQREYDFIKNDSRMQAIKEIEKQRNRVKNHLNAYIAFLKNLERRITEGDETDAIVKRIQDGINGLQMILDGKFVFKLGEKR